jgi:transcriptional regulator with XRE-family HTH domain
MNNELDYIGIGKRIRHYRKLRDMSQEQLAEKIDISVTHMSHIETGSTKLSLQVITSIAKELEVKVDMLIYDQDKQSDYCYEIEDIVSSSSKKEQKILYNALKSIKASLHS